MKKTIFLLIASAFLAVSCQESMKQLSDRVFELAEYQLVNMDKELTDTTFPKTTKYGQLVTSESKWWCAGFYPGSLWYTYLYTGNEEVKALAEKNTAKLYGESQRVRSHDIGFVPQDNSRYQRTPDPPVLDGGVSTFSSLFRSRQKHPCRRSSEP